MKRLKWISGGIFLLLTLIFITVNTTQAKADTTYKVVYNANGGSGGPTYQVAKYSGYVVKLSTARPTRYGYSFLGWSTTKTATSATYQPGGYVRVSSNITLYAVWRRVTYKVTYNVNGGSGSIASQTKYYGSNLKLTTSKPTRTGYSFLGWATSSSATGPNYTSGATYKNEANVTLYAVWRINTYQVYFNANGGAGAPATGTKKYGQAYKIPSTVPTRSGYIFVGWNTSANATTGIKAGASYTGNATVVYYAIWKDARCKVTYSANGGAGGPTYQYAAYAGYVIKLSSSVPTRYGYRFLGWSTSRTATSASYASSSSLRVNADLTLYAVWQRITYSIKYNVNGGTGTIAAQIKYYGTALTLNSTKPTRTGYTFIGWSTSSSATTATYSAGAKFNTEANTTLYAVWKINTYLIEFINGSQTVLTATKTYGVAYTIPSMSLTKNGYTFAGWSTSSNAITVNYKAGVTITANTKITLYAVWSINTYTVAFNANGGTGSIPANQCRAYGSSFLIDSVQPNRTGYNFLGWSTSKIATQATYKAGSSCTLFSNMTLYAVWEKKYYLVSYDIKGGIGQPESTKVEHGGNYQLTSMSPYAPGSETLIKSCYEFLGWRIGNGEHIYVANENVTITEDVTFTAVWKEEVYTSLSGLWEANTDLITGNGYDVKSGYPLRINYMTYNDVIASLGLTQNYIQQIEDMYDEVNEVGDGIRVEKIKEEFLEKAQGSLKSTGKYIISKVIEEACHEYLSSSDIVSIIDYTETVVKIIVNSDESETTEIVLDVLECIPVVEKALKVCKYLESANQAWIDYLHNCQLYDALIDMCDKGYGGLKIITFDDDSSVIEYWDGGAIQLRQVNTAHNDCYIYGTFTEY